eukprot:1158908-Prorocentrum_minimum.AAC.1
MTTKKILRALTALIDQSTDRAAPHHPIGSAHLAPAVLVCLRLPPPGRLRPHPLPVSAKFPSETLKSRAPYSRSALAKPSLSPRYALTLASLSPRYALILASLSP